MWSFRRLNPKCDWGPYDRIEIDTQADRPIDSFLPLYRYMQQFICMCKWAYLLQFVNWTCAIWPALCAPRCLQWLRRAELSLHVQFLLQHEIGVWPWFTVNALSRCLPFRNHTEEGKLGDCRKKRGSDCCQAYVFTTFSGWIPGLGSGLRAFQCKSKKNSQIQLFMRQSGFCIDVNIDCAGFCLPCNSSKISHNFWISEEDFSHCCGHLQKEGRASK